MAGCSGNDFLNRGGGRREMIQYCADKLGQALALRHIVGPRRVLAIMPSMPNMPSLRVWRLGGDGNQN